LRMKPWLYSQVLWNDYHLSIPLRMKRRGKFYSQLEMPIRLSIPLRMKHGGPRRGGIWAGRNGFPFNSFEDETQKQLRKRKKSANPLSIPLRMKQYCQRRASATGRDLSIPLRMKQFTTPSRVYTVNRLTFNSFEDETLTTGYLCLLRDCLTFNSFEDETGLQ